MHRQAVVALSFCCVGSCYHTHCMAADSNSSDQCRADDTDDDTEKQPEDTTEDRGKRDARLICKPLYFSTSSNASNVVVAMLVQVAPPPDESYLDSAVGTH